MAELVGGAFLSSILNVAFDRLTSPEAVNWIRGKKLDKKLETLKTTLYAAQALLNDADKKLIKDTAVQDWLDSLKDAVYKADDLLDEVSTKAATQKDPGNFWSHFLNLQEREIANRMEDITQALKSILEHKDALGFKEIPKEDMSWRITTSLVEVSGIYGRDKDKEALIKLLLDDTSDAEISVIPIVGQGGIGKTTLAQLVYDDDEVKQNFDLHAWVCVSEEFDAFKVTKAIIHTITPGSCNMDDLNLLQHDLKEKLSRRKFLVVLDDAWNENYNDWNRLLKPFQHGVKGSKIIITTRNSKVASVVQTVPPHELSVLSHEDCWLVFAKHALLSIDSIKNPTLEKIGREIVNKCKGLPLAAQTLGGLLRGNYDVEHWNHVLKSKIWEIPEGGSQIISALRISYYYLPPCLKECFVFCSLYPKDYRFKKHELIWLWVAENFIQPKGSMTLEEVGYEYFKELVARSFLQLDSTHKDLYVMHDLMHDLAMFYAGKFYFRAEELENAAEIGIKARHLSHNASGNYPISKLLAACGRVKHTRTFLEVNLYRWVPFNMENALCILLTQLKYLRVLSFKSCPLHQLPDSIGEMIHLRYLDLSQTGIATLPNSLSNLHNLQTLKLKKCRTLEMLPNGMHDLINLLHLDIRETPLREMPKGMSKLKHLQVLSDFIVGKHVEYGIRELGALANLHGSLSIAKLENVKNGDEALEARISDKKHINNLHLSWSSGKDGDITDSQIERDILDKLRPHTDLKELSITGYRGTMFSDWLGHSSYHNVTGLTLRECRNCWMLPLLGQLPFLGSLSISGFDKLSIVGAEFYQSDESCCETPFPSLKSLKFERMFCWKEWHSSKMDAFPQLKSLRIISCPMLMGDLPNHLPALERLSIEDCEQLACNLPIAPAIKRLSIYAANDVRIQELPLSLHTLIIDGSQLVKYVFEVITNAQLARLRVLKISNCSSAVSFPGACMPASLRELEIKNCKELEFPLQQQQQESLRYLSIGSSCNSLTSLQLDVFPNLWTLELRSCKNMKSLVVSQDVALSSLTSLSIYGCPSLVSFFAQGSTVPQLESVSIWGCPEIDSFMFSEESLPPKLRYLQIINCKKLVRCLASMAFRSHGLTNLLIGDACEIIKCFPKEGCLPASLQSMSLWGFPSLETLDCNGLVHLTSLQELQIEECPKLENITGETLPASLTELGINACPLLGDRCLRKDPQIWPKISHIPKILLEDRDLSCLQQDFVRNLVSDAKFGNSPTNKS